MTNVKEKILTRSETAAVLKEYFDYIQKFLPPLDDIKWYKGVEVALEYLQGLTAADIPFEGVGEKDYNEAVETLLHYRGLRPGDVKSGRGEIIAFAELLRRRHN